MLRFIFICGLCHFIVNCNAGVVSFINPCKQEDKACLLTSAQAAVPYIVDGLPDLSIPALDPLVLDDVRADEGDLKLGFHDLTVTGIKNCKFVAIEFPSNVSLAFDVECPVVATGKYSVSGKMFKVPIDGDGDLELKTDNIKISVKAVFEILKGADGKEHFNIISLEKNYEPIDKVSIQLKNLFHGDEKKAKPVVDILNISWKEVMLSIGKPVIHQLIDKASGVVNQFFLAVPADELFL